MTWLNKPPLEERLRVVEEEFEHWHTEHGRRVTVRLDREPAEDDGRDHGPPMSCDGDA